MAHKELRDRVENKAHRESLDQVASKVPQVQVELPVLKELLVHPAPQVQVEQQGLPVQVEHRVLRVFKESLAQVGLTEHRGPQGLLAQVGQVEHKVFKA